MEIGKRIKNLRKSNNMTQQELADMLNIGREHIAKIETNKELPSLTLLMNLCNNYKITLSDFFNYDISSNIELQALINEAKKLDNEDLRLITQVMGRINRQKP